jgi:hypothetical protein
MELCPCVKPSLIDRWHLSVCLGLSINYFSETTGRTEYKATAAKHDLSAPLPNFMSIEARSYEVLNRRWPLYAVQQFIDFLTSPSPRTNKKI